MARAFPDANIDRRIVRTNETLAKEFGRSVNFTGANLPTNAANLASKGLMDTIYPSWRKTNCKDGGGKKENGPAAPS